MKEATLVYCVKKGEVLLGMKKRGFGNGKFNGYGGKVEKYESLKSAAARELFEETKILCNKNNLDKVAEIDFFFDKEKEWNQKVHVYLLEKWVGDAEETEEMKPFWYKLGKLPLKKMWIDDEHWLPLVLKGKKIKAVFEFCDKGNSIKSYQISKYKFK